MNTTKVTVFIESEISRTFLFECARYWASEGHQVHFIKKSVQENLPPTLQGVRPTNSEEATYAEFMQILFVTAPTTKDFIDYMVNLRQTARLPKVLVVEDITSFAENTSEAEFLLMCSYLKNTANFCSRAHDNLACLIVSTKFDADKLNTINFILLPDKIWRSYETKSGENSSVKHYVLRELSLNPLCNVYQELHFSLLEKEDGKYVRLNDITSLFDDNNCSFNNVIS